MDNLKDIKALLLDLDGTIYIGNEPIGDIVNTLKFLRSKGIQIVYITNNSSKTQSEYIKKLKKIKLYDKSDIIYSSLMASADYILDNRPNCTVYPVATKSAVRYFNKRGIKTSFDANTVLLTFDTEMTFDKIKRANELLNNGAFYISSHPDTVCPAPVCSMPDAGSFINLFKTSCNRVPDVIIGKPNVLMANYLSKMLNVPCENIAMAGDRLNTDIAFGVNSKMKTVLVLTGETTLEMVNNSNIKPSFILNDINEIKNLL